MANKRKSADGNEEQKEKKPRAPKRLKVTLDSDPAISTDHTKINVLLSQGKSWRYVPFSYMTLTLREIANYYPDHNADTIKKRYQLCNRVLMETFSVDDVPSFSKNRNDGRIPS